MASSAGYIVLVKICFDTCQRVRESLENPVRAVHARKWKGVIEMGKGCSNTRFLRQFLFFYICVYIYALVTVFSLCRCNIAMNYDWLGV